jgi:hypothetical protein
MTGARPLRRRPRLARLAGVVLLLGATAALGFWQLTTADAGAGRPPTGDPAALARGDDALVAPTRLELEPKLAPDSVVALEIDSLALASLVPADDVTLAVLDPTEAASEPLRSAGLRGALPFRTQRDGSQWAGSNCGPAALGMVLSAWGLDYGNDDLRYYTHSYQGTWGRRGGTALQHMAQVAEDFGVRTAGLYESGSFRRWTIEDLREQVGQGHPVIVLVKYRLLPGRESSNVRFDHYVVLWDLTPDGFVYNDPIYPTAGEGFARFMTNRQLAEAMGPTMESRQAVAFMAPL